MPDQLNKQSLINLLIDSPLREPIKINLIDIVNNTQEPDLPKVFSTITKELEIFQKATDRRMKLADETIAKLGGTTQADSPKDNSTPSPTPAVPPLDLPPLPTVPTQSAPVAPATPTPEPPQSPEPAPALSVPPLDLPPLPTSTSTEPAMAPETPVVETPLPTTPTPDPSTFTPLGGTSTSSSSDEDALAEIQKELDSLKNTTASEISSAAAEAPAPENPAPTTPQA